MRRGPRRPHASNRSATQAQIRVSWNKPADNGDAIDGYQLDVMQGSSVVRTIPVSASETSQAVVVNTSTTDYTFRVMAQNKAGWGAFSAASAPQRGFTPPGAPPNVSASTPSGNSAITVSYGAAAGNGASAGELSYQYSLNNGNWAAMPGNNVIGNLSNGTTYTVRVRAVATVGGVQEPGAASAPSNSVIPYGQVRAPNVSASASGTSITFRWSPPSTNGRDIAKMEIAIEGVSGWHTVG